ILHQQTTFRETRSFTVKNRSEQPRLVLIEHVYRPDYKLMKPEKPAERSRDYYRFEVKAAPDVPVELVVVEELPRTETIALTQQTDDNLLLLVRSKAASEKVKAALREALAKKGKLAETRAAVQKEEAALQVIEKDQSR